MQELRPVFIQAVSLRRKHAKLFYTSNSGFGTVLAMAQLFNYPWLAGSKKK